MGNIEAARHTRRDRFRLRLIPVPSFKLSQEGALSWLREEGPAYGLLSRFGYHDESDGARDDFALLALDVEQMTMACVEILGGESVRIERDEEAEPTSLGFLSTIRNLARIVSTPDPDGWGGGAYEDARAWLAVELERRLEELERRGAA